MDAFPPPADHDALPPRVADRVTDGWAASTRTGYARDWERFAEWCAQQDLPALPAAADTLVRYTVAQAEAGYAPASVERALASVAARHAAEGLAVSNKAARLALRSYRRSWVAAGNRARRTSGLDLDRVRMLLKATGDGPTGVRDRALVLLGYALRARRSELAALDVGDARPTAEGLQVSVGGQEAALPFGEHERTCPVRAVHAWLDVLAEAGLLSGPLLRGIDRHGRLAGTPKSVIGGSGRMSGAGINLVVKRLGERAGLVGVTAHSLSMEPVRSERSTNTEGL